VEHALAACRAAAARSGRILALTGAGVSAESGIPTFRGKDGYWTVGAREYHPQELATNAAFRAMPWAVWGWYLYRRGVCRAAAPNAGHHALAKLARALPDRFALITQNVDGLHARAGSPTAQTFPIHGDIQLMRCAASCTTERVAIPDGVPALAKGEDVTDAIRALLVCPRCHGMTRPHVLWFDETYDEERFFLRTVRRLAEQAALLVVAGTSAQTNLPWQVVELARSVDATIIDINVEDNPFGDLANHRVRAPAAAALVAIAEALS
jgi:NAD-dependent protein deacetylase/lipoamidase